MQVTNAINQNNVAPAINDADVQQVRLIIEFPSEGMPVATLQLHERMIRQIDAADAQFERALPNNVVQNLFDKFAQDFIGILTPHIRKYNAWIDSNGNGAWYEQLCLFLAKLPLRVARNIVMLLYSIIESALNAAVHPLNATTNLARLLILLVVELTKPGVWSKLGIGIVGAHCGQLVVTGSPLAVIGICIGAAMTIGGLTAGAIKVAIYSEKGKKFQAVGEELLSQAKAAPDALLTGFCLGLIFGAIQRVTQPVVGKSRPVSEQQPLADVNLSVTTAPHNKIIQSPSDEQLLAWQKAQWELMDKQKSWVSQSRR